MTEHEAASPGRPGRFAPRAAPPAVAATGAAPAAKGLAFVLGAVALYSALHALARLFASPVLGEDDVIDTVLAQDLLAGYAAFPRQPPLYDWLLWLTQQVTGPGIVGFLLIKYMALIATAGFLFLTARRILRDPLFALLTVESLALIYSISWRYHEGFTHEVGAMVAVMASLFFIVRFIEDGRTSDAALLGLTAGLGLLTEPAYGVFLLSTLAAALLQPAVRRALFRPALLLVPPIALAVASPYLIWFLEQPNASRIVANALKPELGTRDAILDAVRGPVAYLSPLMFILPLVFPRWLLTAGRDLVRAPNRSEAPDLEQLVLHGALIAFVLSVIAAAAFNVRGLAVHVLMPLYVTSVIWLFGVARRAAGEDRHIARFTRLAVAIAVFAFGARLANMYVLDPVCNLCRWGIPYTGLADELRSRGFDGTGTIIAGHHEVGGNLRAIFPEARVVARRYPIHTPSGTDLARGDVAVVWTPELTEKELARHLAPDLERLGKSAADAETVTVPWRLWWRPTGWRSSAWKVVVVNR
ncbi:MAG: glycosyltransferase family 39 protein [Hyphomicrobiaceae bacterium]|nr:glycosyltransferase family 39 protein [Hyphomicrobiaceae bacterium]